MQKPGQYWVQIDSHAPDSQSRLHQSYGQTGAVTLIQRFWGACNANVHFHMLFLDGVYIDSADRSRTRFRWVQAPTSDELSQLTHTIAQRVARYLERQGLLVRDAGHCYLTAEGVGRRS